MHTVQDSVMTEWLVPWKVTSDQETDSATHLDKWSKQHHMSLNSQFELHSPKAVFKNN